MSFFSNTSEINFYIGTKGGWDTFSWLTWGCNPEKDKKLLPFACSHQTPWQYCNFVLSLFNVAQRIDYHGDIIYQCLVHVHLLALSIHLSFSTCLLHSVSLNFSLPLLIEHTTLINPYFHYGSIG